ncbi:unnamed protein product [Rotaria sp. Silwood1]|nr:unnamed protein product [Rotaria sp. Silwood1]CAF1661703.1 unnamed protein product [Rotaria sp. Silwood1]
MSISLAIETNVKDAFLHSKSAGDAHVWLHFSDETSQQTNNINCDPKLACVDFGIVLSGIRQRLTQRIILHNETDKNVNIQIEQHRNTSTYMKFDFNMVPDKMIVPMQDAGEIDVLFKLPEKFIGPITEMLDLKINDKIIPNAIQLHVHMIKADVEIGSGAVKLDKDNKEFWTIDFGRVPCCSKPIPKSIELKNLLDCTLNIKAQIQIDENTYHSKLDIIKGELILDGKAITALYLKLQPSQNNSNEEEFEATICLAINPSKTIKWLKVKACIRRPRLCIAYRNRPLIENLSSAMTLTISDFYIGEHRSIPFEFKNIGATDFEFFLKSQDLTWKCENKNLKMNESTAVTIEFHLSSQVQRKFPILILFLNIKYYYTLEIICETSIPRLDLPAKITKIIEISQAAHLQALCYEEDKSLKSIIFEETFRNRSKGVATLSFSRFISKNKQDIKFSMEPDCLKIVLDTDVKINFVYQPIDLCDVKGEIQLQSNCWPQPKMIEFSLEVRSPMFQSRPQTMIEWGKIEKGRITRPLLKIKNKGAKVLRFHVDSVKLQQPFMKVASINRPSGSINHPIEINPQVEALFDIHIECESLESAIQTSSPIELAELNLISLRDPVMSIDGKLKKRSIKILTVGHLSDVDLPRQFNESAFQKWKDLRLISSSWIRDMAMGITTFESHSLLLTMVSAAYVAHSNRISTLPHNIEDYKSLLNPIHHESTILINPLTLDDISNDPSSAIRGHP